MELIFDRDELLKSLQILQGVASQRTALPILSNVLINASTSDIECIATDMEVGICIKVEGTIQEEGTITVSAKKLADIVKELPANETFTLKTTSNHRVEITCGAGVYTIVGLSDEEFPQLPTVDIEPFSIDGETLQTVLRKTEFAASTEEVRYFLNALFFNLSAERTEVVATDTHQLAIAYCAPLVSSENTTDFIVPLRAVREIAKTFADSPSVSIAVFENQILFSDGIATLTTRLIEGSYPPYQKIIPESSDGRIVLNREALLRAVKRVSLLSNPKNYAISLEIEPAQLRISAKTPELGEAHEVVPVESSTGTARIGFDARFVIDALSHMETDEIVVEFSGEFTPVAIKPTDDEQICIIMPMRLQS